MPGGGFEEGLAAPWGTGQAVIGDGPSIWKNRNGCTSTITADSTVRHGGNISMHIVNSTPRAPHVYGTTQQPLALKPNHRYGISLWARASDVRSAGAVSLIVDQEWRNRPIQLPAGTYDWTPFTGEFSSPSGDIQLRILSEDVGEVWIDDIEIVSLEAEEPPAAPPVDPALARVRALTEGLGKFRGLALQDMDAALADLADETAHNDFNQLTERLWPLSDSKIGWSYFFSFSIIAAVRPESTQPIVAFVHPWSDVVLVTSWSIEGESAQLTGAEVIPGELLRTGTISSPGQGPAWIADPVFKPAALAQHVADTVMAFEKKYSAPLVASWRNVWITIKDSAVTRDQLQTTCAALLVDSMARAQIFRQQQEGELAALQPMRRETRRIMELGAAGNMDTLWSEASETLPAAKETFAKLPPESFRNMVVVSTVVGQHEGIVFLAPWIEPDLCLSLYLVDLDQEPRVSRVDVVSFQGAYQYNQRQEKP